MMADTSRHVRVFDDDCGFCTSTARNIAERSTTPIEIHAWQLVDVAQFGLTEADTGRRVYFVTKGDAYGGHLALAQVLWLRREIGWKALGLMMTVPPTCWFASVVYSLLSRFRHRLPGGTPACAIRPIL